jgi:hypothetical protein
MQVCAGVSTLPLHDACWHWLLTVQPEHVPETQASVPFVPQWVPSVTSVCTVSFTPAHASVVQGFPSFAASLESSATVVPPLPSHSILAQSPGCCGGFVVVAEPAAVKTTVQTKPTHAGCAQSLLSPEHSLSFAHCWHVPAPSQKPGWLPR